jgi:glycerol-1-phosphate dehydrogenase [NAD(P)+]
MEFEKIRTMHFPRDIFVGHNAIVNITDVVKRNLRSGSIAIVTGNNTYELAGKRSEEMLRDAGFEVFSLITGEANVKNLESVDSFVKEARAGIVVGVGGGTKIDLAKKSAFDFGIPLVSVPTSASHDGIASPRASIKGNGSVASVEAVMPVAIIADTSVMVKAPFRFLAGGAADVISNITALLDWQLANRLKGEEYSSSAAAISEYASRELIEKAHMILPGVEESVWLVTKQILASGTAMAIASSSRPASGSEHMFAHALELYGPGNSIHGEQVAMGSVVSMYLHGGEWKKLIRTYEKIGVSISAKSYGISRSIAIKSLMGAHSIRKERYTILGESDLSYDAAERTLEVTGVI